MNKKSSEENNLRVVTGQNIADVFEDNNIVVISFWSETSGPCRILEPTMVRLSNEYKGKAYIGKLNINTEVALAHSYAIKVLPNVIFFKNGKKVDELVVTVKYDELKKKLDGLLSAS